MNYVWKLDGNILDSNNDIISTFIDSGGYHVMNLTVEQEPVGIAYYESEIYLNSKPTGVLQTSPTTPRVGEDFEIYLNAFDVETDANIEYLKIKIIDNKGNERAEFEYINQGANFNLIFEVEYAGIIILEYSLIDESGNKNESISSVNVIGWADIFISDIKISGSKEKGAKHQIETILTNYNETYNGTNYNGYTATGYYELFIDSELVHTSSFSIEPERVARVSSSSGQLLAITMSFMLRLMLMKVKLTRKTMSILRSKFSNLKEKVDSYQVYQYYPVLLSCVL